MLPSWRLALNTLAGKRGRTALMIGAVALAASLVVAVSCAIASLQASTELGITKFLGASDARIVHQGNGRFEESLLEKVRSWPEVELATGRLAGSVTLIHADRRRDAETNDLLRMTPSAIGVEFDLDVRFRSRDLVAGAMPSQPNEILIDPATAEKLEAKVGDVLHIQRFGEPIELRVAGIFQRPRLGAVQRPLIEMNRRVLAEAMGKANQLTSIAIILKKNQDKQAFCDRRQAELPSILALEPSEMVRSGYDKQVQASRLGFIVASMMTFMCASFIIVTALTTSVTERQREMAVTRCIGASRAQLFISQLLAGGAIAGAGAVVGVPLGIALTGILVWKFSEHLAAGLTLHPLGLQLAIIGSIGAGVIGALYPAWMASHVSPLQAMSYRARPPRLIGIFACMALGMAFIGGQMALTNLEDSSLRFKVYAYAGLPSLLIGYFILAIPLLIVVVRALAGPVSLALRLPRGMLHRSILATPYRNGFTAGSLMVGIAILVSTWSNMTSLMKDWLGNIKFPDGFVHQMTGIPPHQQQAIANLPIVQEVCPISYLPLRVYDRQIFGVKGLAPPNITAFGFDPDRFFRMNAVQWAAGSLESALPKLRDGTGVIVADRFLTTQQVQIGDRLTLGVGRVRRDFEIVGAVSSAGLDIATQSFGIRSQYMEYSISCVFIDWQTLNETFDNRDAHLMQLNLVEGVSDAEAKRRIAEVAPGVQFHSGRWIMKTLNDLGATMLTVQSVVAFAALVLACLGVGNVILANIHGRRYEYGVLRAIGGHRRMLVKLILGEAALLAITGAIVGTLLGIHLAWMGAMNYRDLAGLPVYLTVQYLPTFAGWAVLIALTLLAAAPGVWSVVRHQPSALLAAGRNG